MKKGHPKDAPISSAAAVIVAAAVVIAAAVPVAAAAAAAEDYDNENDEPEIVVASVTEHIDFLSPHLKIFASAALCGGRQI